MTSTSKAIVLILFPALFAFADAPAVRLVHFTDAAYAGEKATFIFEGRAGERVKVTMDGAPLAEAVFQKSSLELNLVLRQTGILAFSANGFRAEFHTLLPDPRAVLTEQDGRLLSGDRPAVLLAHHRFPPKHDRRWETVSLLRRILADPRPEVRSGVLAGATFIPSHMRPRLDVLTGVSPGFWRTVDLPPCLHEVHALIAAVGQLPPADLLVVALSDTDAERGLSPSAFGMKLEWYLQAVQRRQFPHVCLVPPPFSPRQREQFGHFWPQCRLSALGNDAMFVALHERDLRSSPTASSWAGPVMDQLRRRLRCD